MANILEIHLALSSLTTLNFRADIHRRRADGRTAQTVAALHGNEDIAAWLLAHGAKNELSLLERFVSACARGDGCARAKCCQCTPTCAASFRSSIIC